MTVSSLMSTVKNFYNQYVTSEDRLVIGLTGITFLLGAIYITINALTTQYTGENYVPWAWVGAAPILFALTAFAMYARQHSPRMAFITRSYGLYFFIIVALAVLTTGIQFTPFPLIDKYLAAADKAMGFHTVAILNWTYSHPPIQKFLTIAYNSMGYQLFAVPVIVAMLQDKKALNLYLLAIIFSYFMSTTIYYFFPTAGPTEIFTSPHFLAIQHDTSMKFYQVHHHINVSTFLGGMIAFPSCHVIWAVLCAYAFIQRKYLFIPIALLNICVIASTVLLGWHYLTDVFGGLVVGVIAIVLAHKAYNRLLKSAK